MDRTPELVGLLVEKAAKDQADARYEIVLKLVSAMFDKAASYTNLIVIAGYAGFFAVWSNTKDAMSNSAILWSALCICSSLIVFIAWEVGKMLFLASSFWGYSKVLSSSSEAFDANLKEHETAYAKRHAKTMSVWVFVLIFTIAPAVAGAAILMYGFIQRLFDLVGAT